MNNHIDISVSPVELDMILNALEEMGISLASTAEKSNLPGAKGALMVASKEANDLRFRLQRVKVFEGLKGEG